LSAAVHDPDGEPLVLIEGTGARSSCLVQKNMRIGGAGGFGRRRLSFGCPVIRHAFGVAAETVELLATPGGRLNGGGIVDPAGGCDEGCPELEKFFRPYFREFRSQFLKGVGT
jgi:hypothetical protein